MTDTPAPYRTAYAYNDATLEYIGETRAWLSPLEGTYPLPLYAVPFAPPPVRTPYTTPRLNAARTAWTLVDDYRTVPLWSTRTAQPLAVSLALGDPLPPEATPVPPPSFAPAAFRGARWTAAGWEAVPDYRGASLWRTSDCTAVSNTLGLGDPLPDTVTTLAPPAFGMHQAPRWDAGAGAWALVPDYRGTVYYDAEGRATTITELGQVVPEGATLYPPPPPPPPPAEVNGRRRDALLADAALRIAPLQDAVDLGEATEAERNALAAWKGYRVQLNRLDLAADPVAWPSPPAASLSPIASTKEGTDAH